jgi:hypothetical protein
VQVTGVRATEGVPIGPGFETTAGGEIFPPDNGLFVSTHWEYLAKPSISPGIPWTYRFV